MTRNHKFIILYLMVSLILPLVLLVDCNGALRADTATSQINAVEKSQGVDPALTAKKTLPTNSIRLTAEEKAWLAAHPVIRVSSEVDYAPFDFVENGKSVGYSIDYLEMVARRVGLQLEYVQDTWGNLVTMGKEKKIDLLHTIFYTPERSNFFRYTEPYKTVVNAIYVRDGVTGVQSIADLAGKKVLLPRGDTITEYLPQLIPNLDFVLMDTYETLLKSLSLGQGDATVLDSSVANYLIRKYTLTNIVPAAEADIPSNERDPRYRFAVRNDWPKLQSILQKAMNTITRDEIAKLETRWIGLPKLTKNRKLASRISLGTRDGNQKTAESADGQQQGRVTSSASLVSYKQLVVYGLIIFMVVSLLALILIRTLRRENIAINFGSKWFRGFVVTGLSLFVLVVAFLGWYNLERNKTQHLADVEEALTGLLSIAQDRLDLWLQERLSYMARLGHDPELVAVTRRLIQVMPDRETLLGSDALRDARAFFKDSPDIFSNIGFFIINPDHISIGSMRDANVGTLNLISRQYPEILERAFQGKVGFVPSLTSDVHLDEAFQSRQDKKPPTMFFIGPVQDRAGNTLAVMTLRVDPWRDFTRTMQSFKGMQTGDSYAFDRNGCLLSASHFEDQLRGIGLLEDDQKSPLNIEIRDPGGNLVDGYHSDLKRSRQPLTLMASAAITLGQQMKLAGIRSGTSPIVSNIQGYRDYRGVTVFGAWLWNMDLDLGLALEINEDDALSHYSKTRTVIFSILGFTLLLSVGAVLFVMIIGERTSRVLMQARDNLEAKVSKRTSELMEKQAQLAETQERSTLILNAVGEGIFGLDTNGHVSFVNPSTEKLMGYSREELIGNNVHELVHHSHEDGSHYPEEDCPMRAAYKDGNSHFITDEVLWHKDGTCLSVHYTSTPIYKEGELVGAVVTFRDITALKRVEAELLQAREEAEEIIRASEARLTQAAEAGGLGMWEWRVDLDRVIVSDFWLKLKGLTREKYNRSVDQWADGLHPDDKDQALDLLNRHLEGETEHFEAEYRFQHPRRGWYWEHASARVIERDADGKPLRMVGYHQDVSERKNMEQALSDEHERLQQILDTSPVGVVFSSKGKIHFTNPMFEKMFDVNVGDDSPDLYVDTSKGDFLVAQLTGGERIKDYEIKMYGHNGKIRDMLVNYMPINYGDEDGILGWFLDITDRKNAEQEIKNKFDELSRFRKLAVGREKKMIEIKKEINELLTQLGRESRYKVAD